ncbi:MAG: hypothetical protein HY761_01015 [Candidatus Omnitrophica bacterium]|nr:hypothetical protein [Candidatus Omnitrophota bacterium]
MKKKFIIILICFLSLVVFCVVRDFVIKNIITVVVTNVTGAPTNVGGFSLSVIRQSVKITNFKMYSPEGFPRDIMIDIPLMRVSCDLPSILKGKIYLKELVLDLREMGLVKNKEGKLNVDSLKISQAKGEVKKSTKQMPIQIDLVQLNIGRVVNKDYSAQGGPVIKVYDVGVKKTYKNISSIQQLIALIIAESLKAAGIRGLGIYGVSMLTGVAALPVAAAFTFGGKDYAQQDYSISWDRAYDVGLAVLKESGRIGNENKATGVISADVGGVQVTFKLQKISNNSTRVTVSARKFILPQPEVAAGVMYRISEKLK